MLQQLLQQEWEIVIPILLYLATHRLVSKIPGTKLILIRGDNQETATAPGIKPLAMAVGILIHKIIQVETGISQRAIAMQIAVGPSQVTVEIATTAEAIAEAATVVGIAEEIPQAEILQVDLLADLGMVEEIRLIQVDHQVGHLIQVDHPVVHGVEAHILQVVEVLILQVVEVLIRQVVVVLHIHRAEA